MLIANQEPFWGDVPDQEWPESCALKKGLLSLWLHNAQQLDLA